MDKIEIFPMTRDDILGVYALEKECFCSPWSEKSLEEELENENAVFLVAKCGQAVVGYIGCILVCSEANVTNVAVTESYRRQKIGSLLIENLISALKEKGAQSVFLEVRVSNAGAIALYQKHGFSVCGERKNFYREPTENAYIMTFTI